MDGLIGLLVLVFDIFAIVQIIGSGASTVAKVGWSLLVLLLPMVGLIIWAIAGPRRSSSLA